MKTLILTIVLLHPLKNPPLQQQKTPQPTHYDAQSGSPQTSTPSTIINMEQGEPLQTPPDKPQEHDRDYQFWGLIVNAVLVFITAGVAVISGIGAWAAKASADAVVNGERAWIFVKQHHPPKVLPDGQLLGAVVLNNFGKTPARVIALSVEILITDSNESPGSIPIYGSGATTVAPEFIPQGKRMPLVATRTITESEKDDVGNGKKFIWLCGSVTYENIFRKVPAHRTSFCYVFKKGILTTSESWHMAGPQEYNEAS